MRKFVADLHVHSLLSPCAAVEMTPRNIVWHAVQHAVDIIAITDHNACDNVVAALEAAKGTEVTVLLGMEVESKEEAHLIVLFEKMRQLKAWEQFIKSHMSGRLNDADRFGAQFIVDAEDNFIAEKTELLLTSLTVGVSEITSQVKNLGGICIASHVDRPTYSIISQLGFIPPDVDLAAVEVSRNMSIAHAAERIPAIGRLPVITASDAHVMDDFINGPKTTFYLEQPTIGEIRQALLAQNSRKVVV